MTGGSPESGSGGVVMPTVPVQAVELQADAKTLAGYVKQLKKEKRYQRDVY